MSSRRGRVAGRRLRSLSIRAGRGCDTGRNKGGFGAGQVGREGRRDKGRDERRDSTGWLSGESLRLGLADRLRDKARDRQGRAWRDGWRQMRGEPSRDGRRKRHADVSGKSRSDPLRLPPDGLKGAGDGYVSVPGGVRGT